MDDHPEATALVFEMREQMIAIFKSFDAIHLQIARSYPLEDNHDPEAWAILKALKAQVDPKGLMNPGSLGL